MRPLSLAQPLLHRWPRRIAYLATVLLVALAYAAPAWAWPEMQVYPFFFFYPAIILSSVLFNHGSGYLATALSAGLVTLFLPPIGSVAVVQPRDWFALAMFVVIGLVLSALLNQLRKAMWQAEEAVARARAAEGEKDLFLQEAVHRFKNDITIVTALLRTQARQLKDDVARTALQNMTNRILVMSRVHERLRVGSCAAPVVSTDAFIAGLCEDLKASLLDLRPITVEADLEAHTLAHERAVAVGLIINEAVTNALKYAFPNDARGTVRVSFRRHSGEFILQVTDDGVGYAPGREPQSGGTGGMGSKLIRSMAQQLNGRLVTQPDHGAPGTTVQVPFPV
jgi:two-component sensor histidine kinase